MFNNLEILNFLNYKNLPITLENLHFNFPHYENSKSSKKNICKDIKSYAANTYQGLIR